MRIARVLVKQSAVNEMKIDYSLLFTDPRIIVEIQPDSLFNKDIAVDQITERLKINGKK